MTKLQMWLTSSAKSATRVRWWPGLLMSTCENTTSWTMSSSWRTTWPAQPSLRSRTSWANDMGTEQRKRSFIWHVVLPVYLPVWFEDNGTEIHSACHTQHETVSSTRIHVTQSVWLVSGTASHVIWHTNIKQCVFVTHKARVGRIFLFSAS